MSGALEHWAAVAAGGAIGACGRFLVAGLAARAFGPAFPWGTLIVNVAGSLAIGVLAVWFAGRDAGVLRGFMVVGALGAFTTFSTFSLDFAGLWRGGAAMAAFGYAAASVLASLCAVFAGLALGALLFKGASG
ncbi:MAG: CrcB family protein [Pseudomonadota bacterium]